MSQKPKKLSLPVIEALEPRLLFSADIFGGLVDAPDAGDSLQSLLDESTDGLAPQLSQDDIQPDASPVSPLVLDESEYQAILSPGNRLRSELVFVDPATPDYQRLLDDLLAREDDQRQIEVVVLEADRDGVAQISDILAGFRELDAVHIISHGGDGAIRVGNSTLDHSSLDAASSEIQLWANSFSQDGDLLIYGCDLASTEQGEHFVGALSRLTGADVSASDDLTGHKNLGGDWELEYRAGEIETAVAVSAESRAEYQHTLDNITGTAGDDVLSSSAGDDVIDGLDGNDTVDYSTATSSVTVDVTNTAAQNTGGAGTDTLSSIEGVIGSAHDDTFAFSSPVNGAVYTVDGGAGGNDTIDLTGYNIANAVFADGSVTIDTGAGFSFQIDYSNIDSVQFGDVTATVLAGDTSAVAFNGSVTYIEGDAAFTINHTGGGTIDWAYVAATNSLSISDTNSTSGSSAITITSHEGSNFSIDSIASDGVVGSLTTNVDIAQITFTGDDNRIDNIIVSNGAGTIGSITYFGDMAIGGTVTIDANVGTFALGPGLDIDSGTFLITGDLRTVDVPNFVGGTVIAERVIGQFDSVADSSYSNNFATPTKVTLDGSTSTESAPNVAPTAADGTLEVDQGSEYSFTAADFSYSDQDGDAFSQVQITSLEHAGSLELNTAAVTLGQIISKADIDAGNLKFIPDPGASGAGYDSFNFKVNDGIEYSLTEYTITFTIAVNDAPRFTGAPDGNVITDIANSSETAWGIAVQADGKSVVGGFAWNGSDYDFLVTRYNIDGTLDTTFGGGDGIANVAIGTGNDNAYAITLQPDGKILLTGITDNGVDKDFALTRLNTDGTLDLSFGTAGSVITDFDNANDYPKSVAVQSDGKIVIAGHANISGTNNFAIVRYNSDGTLDTSFDGDGKVTTNVSAGFPSHIHGMALQPDGKIVAIGDYQDGSGSDFAIVRYNTNGSMDTSWDGDGIVITAVGAGSTTAQSISVQPDGKIVAGGTYNNGTDSDFVVLRYDTNGTLDTSFGGGDGIAGINISSNSDYVQDMVLQPDGKIVLSGYSNNGSNNDFAVARLNNDGSLDTSFGGGNGFAVNPSGTANDAAYAMALQADGSILLAGFNYGTYSEFALQRYTSSGDLDTSFGYVNTLDGAPGYTLGEPAVVLDSDVQIFDAELSAADSFSGASLTLVRNGGANVNDLFSATGNLAPLTESANLVLSGVTVGTVTTNSDGELTLLFNANATQARINETIQSIAYANSGNTPAYVQIDWTFDDGNSGAQGTGGALQVTGSTTVAVTRQLGSQQSLILSTLDDVSNSGAPGLANWTEGEVLQFSDPTLTFGPGGTNGTLSSVLDLNPYFDSGDVDIAALHYVTTDITVGSGANTFDLKVGDVLFALDADQTIGATTYYDNDVHVFRPDTPGDYSTGTISLLLDTLSTADTRAITLVEQDTLVGDVTLLAGTFLFSDSNNPSEIRHFDATGVGAGNTTGTRQVFLNATGAFNITEEISGLELIEVETTIGGETLAVGTILASVAVADDIGNNSLTVDDSDIVKLTVTKTIMGSATSEAVASLFMDGSNVALYYNAQDIDALSLTAAPTNDAPIITDGPDTDSLTETDAALTSSDTLTVGDVDTTDVVTASVESVAVTGTGSTGLGNAALKAMLSVDPTAILDNTETSDMLTWSFDSDAEAFNDLAAGETLILTYTVKATDDAGTPLSDTETVTITITGSNDAPTLDNTGATTLPTITKLQTNNGGVSVATVIASSGDTIMDVDSGAVEGIAITTLASGNGTWEYSIDGGASWNAIGGVSDASALLLGDNDLVRFVPNGVSGTTASFDFHAWDQTTGAAGTKVDASIGGGSTAFSTAAETADITVVDVNTAPVLDNTKSPVLTSTDEDAGAPSGVVGSLVSELVDFASPAGQVDNVTDADSGAGLGIAITAADTTNGTWFYSIDNGSNWNALGAVSDANARLLAADVNTRLYFQANANYHGTLTNAITFHAWDQTSGTNGGTANMLSSYTLLDQFSLVSYNNNDGTAQWSSDWIDIDAKVNGGSYSISNSATNLNIKLNNTIDWVYREANLLNATSATLSFDYTSDLDTGVGGLCYLQVSNGGASYTTIATFSDSDRTGTGTFSADISAYASADSRVRFLTAGSSTPTKQLEVDNFQIVYNLSGGGSSAFSTATDTASLTVNPIADTPSVTSATTDEDTQSTTGLVISRNVADGTEVTHYKITGITNGTLYQNDGTTQITNGSFITFAEGNAGLKFTPTADFNGSGSFTTQASTSNVDTDLGGSTVDATITVNPLNDAPAVATNTGTTVDEGSAGNILTSAMLNEGDPDDSGSGLVYTVTNEVDNGTLKRNGTVLGVNDTFTQADIDANLITYDHNGSETFTDSFGFSLADGGEDGSTPVADTFSITINPVNDNDPVAVDEAITLNEGGTATSLDGGATSVITNDTDSDLPNDTLTVAVDTDVTHGSLTLNADGTFSYTHDDSENLSDSFTYTVSDADGGVTDTGTVTITINPVDDNDPVAVDEAITLNEGGTATSLDGGATSVLANDSDTDLPNDALTVAVDTDVTHGSLTLNADGTFSYTHDGSENLSDSFTYTVSDADGGATDTGTVTITVNPVNDNDPLAVDEAITLNEGGTATSLDGGATSVITNDTDSDLPNDTLTVTVDTDITHGSLTLNADGTFSYTHDGSENLSDSFTYTVSDADGGVTDTGTVTITINPVNDNDPVAVDEAITLNEGGTATSLDGGATSVLANDSDTDLPNDTLTVAVDTDVTHGSLTLNADGTFSYTHDGSENLSDSFTYTVSDADGGATDTGTVTITVNPVNDNDPVAVDEAITLNEGGTATSLDGGATSVITNDTDSDLPNDTLIVAVDTDVTYGSLTLNADGTFSYTHDGSENFTDSFTYIVSDTNGGVTDTGTVTITINPVNDNDPVAVDEAITLNEGGTATSLDGGATSVLANDSDTDLPNDALTVAVDTDVTHGSLTLNADGTFSYTHDGSENLSDSFTYTVSDADGGVTDTGTVTITVNPVNDNDPLAVDEAITLNEGGTATSLDGGATSVITNDTDSDLPNDTLTVTVDTDITHGSLTLNADGTFSYTHDGSENLSDSFTYTVSDADGGVTDTGTVTITVNPVNDAPAVATNTGATVDEGSAGNMLTSAMLNEGDPDDSGSGLVYTVTNDVDNGTLKRNGIVLGVNDTFTQADIDANLITYDHNGGETFTDSFGFSLADGGEDGSTPVADTFSITINPVNDNDPVAVDEAITLNEGGTATSLDGGATSVLANDSDTDLPNDTLTVTVDTDVTHGSLTLNADGTFSYTHDDSENLSDSFTYTVSDANGGVTDTGTVTITVNPVNDNDPLAVDEAITLNEGGTATSLDGGATSVITNDTDSDLPNDTLTVAVDTDVTHGSLTLNADGTFSYTHDGSENFSDSFTYIVADADGGATDTGTVTITINPVNDNDPVAVDEAITLNEGGTATSLDGGASTVLTNDSDTDLPNDTLTVAVDTDVTNGSLTLNADGTFSYTHDGSENFSDSFTYVVSDADSGVTDTGTVTITVNPVNDNDPVAVDESITVNEGGTVTALDGGATSVLANDSDTDLPNDTLTVAVDTDVTHGSLTLNADGTFSYTHDGSENLSDGFTYTVSDANGGVTDTGTVTITVNPVNDNDPVAVDEAITLNEGGTATSLDGGATSVLTNDTDADLPNDTLTVAVAINVSHGSLTLNPDGTFSYTHDGSENFSDSFTYVVADADGGVTDTGTVTITVNPVNNNDPVAVDETITVAEGGTVTSLVSGATSVITNDTDSDLPNDTLTVTVDTDVTHGGLTLNTDGTFSYTHDGSGNFTDSFTYTVSDANGGVTDTGTVTITVNPMNDNDPVAVDETITLNEGGTATSLDGGATSVLTNDTDADLPNDTLTVAVAINVSHGSLTLNPDGTFSYTHDGSENFSDSFTYVVADADGGVTDTGTVTITVNPVNNNDPVAVDEAITVSEGGTVTALDGGATSVLTNDTDTDLPNDTLTVAVAANVSQGSLTLNVDGTFSYTHDGSENLSDSFTYTVSDANGGVTDTGTVTITVNPVNDAPVGILTVSGTPSYGQTLTADGSAIQDADGLGMLNYQWLRDGVAISGATANSYTLVGEDVASRISVEVHYTDGGGAVETVTSGQTGLVDRPVETETRFQLPDSNRVETESGFQLPASPAVETEPGVQSPASSGDTPADKTPAADPDNESVEQETAGEATAAEERQEDSRGTAGDGVAEIDLAAMVGEIQPLDGAAVTSVAGNFRAESRQMEELKVTFAPVTPKWIDLKNLDIAPFELEGREPIEVKSLMHNEEFVNSLESMNKDLDDALEEEKGRYRLGTEAAAGVSMSLSAGFVSWVLRGGSLMASFMSVVPMWKQLDPLPILGAAMIKNGKRKVVVKDGPDEGSEEVESMFNPTDSR